jgi:hypothetical protein
MTTKGSWSEQLDYTGVALRLSKPRLRTEGFYTVSDHDNHLTLDSIKMLLSESALGSPHGFDLLKPLPLPKFVAVALSQISD